MDVPCSGRKLGRFEQTDVGFVKLNPITLGFDLTRDDFEPRCIPTRSVSVDETIPTVESDCISCIYRLNPDIIARTRQMYMHCSKSQS
jgi:hypothetical protein